MKPHRVSAFADAVPVDGRGRRTEETLSRIAERDRLLRAAADRFYPGTSQREAARRLHQAISRYSCCAWQRERADLACPPRHAGKLTALLWQLLKVRDAIPSEPTVRRALGSIREPQDGVM